MSNLPSWAKIGAKVVCISIGPWYSENQPALTQHLTIRDLMPYRESWVLWFEEIRNKPQETDTGFAEPGFNIRRFRPLISQADDIHMFRKLLHEMPITERLDRIAELLDLPEDVTSHLDFP